MNNFDTNRFLNYARYDRTINKTFYRNMSLIAILTMMGVALVGFICRWGLYKLSPYTSMGDYSQAPATVALLIATMSILTTVFAGCTFHNLRTKQSRIFELTLPATKLEKYIWHLTVSIIGSFIICCIGLVLADALNALLNLCVYPLDAQSSLIATLFKFTDSLIEIESRANIKGWAFGMHLITLSSAFFSLSFYVLGNTYKYRYNVIITYAIQQVISILIYISMMIMHIMTGCFDDITHEDIVTAMNCVSILFIFLGIFCFWYAYKRYGRALVISKMNK